MFYGREEKSATDGAEEELNDLALETIARFEVGNAATRTLDDPLAEQVM